MECLPSVGGDAQAGAVVERGIELADPFAPGELWRVSEIQRQGDGPCMDGQPDRDHAARPWQGEGAVTPHRQPREAPPVNAG